MSFAFCKVTISQIRCENNDKSEIISQCLFADTVELIEENNKWIKIKTIYDSYIGWVDKNHFETLTTNDYNNLCHSKNTIIHSKIIEIQTPWGKQDVLKGSVLPISSNEKIFHIGKYLFQTSNIEFIYKTWESFSFSYLNSPYLWGGKSHFGIDCSGFTQIIFKFRNIFLKRDAYQQAEQGELISFSQYQKGDLAFFENEQGKITHVGILLDHQQIIHSSSWVRIDKFDNKGIFNLQTNEYSHKLKFIKRIS